MIKGNIEVLRNKIKEAIFPVTIARIVFMNDGTKNVEETINEILESIEKVKEQINSIDPETLKQLLLQMIDNGLFASKEDVDRLKKSIADMYTKGEIDSIITELFTNPVLLNNYINTKIKDGTLVSGDDITEILNKLAKMENQLNNTNTKVEDLLKDGYGTKIDKVVFKSNGINIITEDYYGNQNKYQFNRNDNHGSIINLTTGKKIDLEWEGEENV